MFGLSVGDAKSCLVGSIVLSLLVLAPMGLFFRLSLGGGSAPESARDFEECVDDLPAGVRFQQPTLPLHAAQQSLMMRCNARFAGRRKPGGGYSYYDFMQDRSFDIAGPNPTPAERNRIDREYIGYLDIQRQESVSAELAKRQDEQLRADLERAHQPVGRPLVLTPKSPSPPVAKRTADRAKSAGCDHNSLACGWSKLSAAVKDAFASSSRSKR